MLFLAHLIFLLMILTTFGEEYNYETPNYMTSSSLLSWPKYSQQVTARSTKETALYTNICDRVESPIQISVSSSGPKP
jgi:hypothetical protein